MFKRIMKIVGIILGCLVAVLGVSVGIFALSGGFTEEKIEIKKLYFDNTVESTDDVKYEFSDTLTRQTIYSLNDVTTRINFSPIDSTNRDLKVKVTGVDGVLDNQAELEQGIKAGEDFTLKIRKDANNNNCGGVVHVVATSENGIAQVSITLVVDVAIPDNTMYFAGENNNKVTASGKSFTLAKNNTSSYIYLKSELYNAFYLPVSSNNFQTVTGNLKSTQISYEYYKLGETSPFEIVDNYDFSKLTVEKVYDNTTHTYAYYYKIPIVPRESGTIIFKAKTHRTYAIQQEFEANGFDKLKEVIGNRPVNASAATAMRTKFEEFINKYISYFDGTDESYEFFKKLLDNDGTISLNDQNAIKALNYVYATCTATVEVTAVNLNQIKSTSTPVTYHVFDTVNFSKKENLQINGKLANSVYNTFDLSITLNGEDGKVVEGSQDENSTLYDTLTMGAYVYRSLADFEGEGGGEEPTEPEVKSFIPPANANYEDYIPVYGFKMEKGLPVLPITPYIAETMTITELEEYRNEDGTYIVIGYLCRITSAMDSNKYMQIDTGDISGEPYWTVDFDVPMPAIIEQGTDINKALYFRFSVNGVNLKTSKRIDRETFTRVYIDFTQYEFVENNRSLLKIESSDTNGNLVDLKTNMALNTNLSNASSYALNKQPLLVDTTTNSILNYSDSYISGGKTIREVEYKSIMYFAEANSNKVGETGAKQIVTMGKYNFSSMTGVPYTFGDGEESLLGERIPTYNMVDSAKQFYIQTVNASTEDADRVKQPVKIFAVVYLSDRQGNPIDLNGKKIVINEDDDAEPVNIYVIAISDTTTNNMTSIIIDNFVDNINFYTVSKGAVTICKDSEDLPVGMTFDAGEWVKRNDVSKFVYTENGSDVELNATDLSEYKEFLMLKLLRNKDFNIHMTNFELSSTGDIVDAQGEVRYSVVDINGVTLAEKAYVQNVKENKQIALNNLKEDFDTSYTLSPITNVTLVDSKTEYKVDDMGNCQYITFTLKANSEAEISTTNLLYLTTKSSSAPYSDKLAPAENSSNMTVLTVNKLEVYDVTMSNMALSNTLVASYKTFKADSTEADQGTVDFYEYLADGGNKQAYTPIKVNDIVYSVSTNLIINSDAGMIINNDIVDSSQAILEDTEETNDSIGNDILEYIEYFTGKDSRLNVNIAYSQVLKYARLKNDLVYRPTTVGDKDNVWCIGDTIFDVQVQGEGKKYIEINGVKYTVNEVDGGGYELRIPTNTFFPVVTQGSKNVMLALGEEFVLESRTDGGIETYYTFKTESVSTSVTEIAVDLLNSMTVEGVEGSYYSSKYISTTAEEFTLKMGEDHNIVYARNDSGRYRYNSDKKAFELAPEDFNGDRYVQIRRDGITAFVLVKFSFVPLSGGLGYEREINKVISFDLIQKDLNFRMVVGKDGDDDVLNSSLNKLIIPSKKDSADGIEVALNPNGTSNPPYIISDDDSIFVSQGSLSHINIIANIDGLSVTRVGNAIRIKRTANFSIESSRTFQISYKYKGETRTETFHILIEPDYTVNFSGEIDGGTVYRFTVDAYGTDILSFRENEVIDGVDASGNPVKVYSLSHILGLGGGATLGLFSGSTGIESYTLTLKGASKSNITYDDTTNSLLVGESIVGMTGKEYVEFTITVRLDNGDTITLSNPLRVEINPTYRVEVKTLTTTTDGAPRLYNGTELIGDYIKVYAYNTNTQNYDLAKSSSEVSSLFTVTANELALTDAVLDVFGGTPKTEDTPVELVISYGNGLEVTRYAVVVGIEMYYSTKGGIGDNYSDRNNFMPINSNISLYALAGQSITLEDYFVAYTSGGATQLNIALKVAGSDTYIRDSITASEAVYEIWYNLSDSGTWKYLTDTTYTLTVNVYNMFYRVDGDYEGNETFDSALNATENKVSATNIDLAVAEGETKTLDNYITLYASDNTKVPVFVNANGNFVNTVTETGVFNLAWREEIVGSSGVEYRYHYLPITVTITVAA